MHQGAVEKSPVTLEDLKEYECVLSDSDSRRNGAGLFYEVDRSVLAVILEKAQIARIAAGQTIYPYRASALNLPLCVVLEGRFRVSRTILDSITGKKKEVNHDDYGPGLIFGEAELLARDIAIDMNDGDITLANITLGNVECVAGPKTKPEYGRVLIISAENNILDTNKCICDAMLASNIARIVSWKLLRIGGVLIEREQLSPRETVLNYLSRKERAAGYTSEAENFTLELTQAEVVNETHIKTSTVSNIFTYLSRLGLKYEKGTVMVPHAGFFQHLLESGSTGRGRPKGGTSSKTKRIKKEGNQPDS